MKVTDAPRHHLPKCASPTYLPTPPPPTSDSDATAAYNSLAPVPVTTRSDSQVAARFGGLPLVAPGVVRVSELRAGPGNPFPQPADLYGGLARVSGDQS